MSRLLIPLALVTVLCGCSDATPRNVGAYLLLDTSVKRRGSLVRQ